MADTLIKAIRLPTVPKPSGPSHRVNIGNTANGTSAFMAVAPMYISDWWVSDWSATTIPVSYRLSQATLIPKGNGEFQNHARATRNVYNVQGLNPTSRTDESA